MSEWPIVTFAELVRQGTLEIGDGYRAKLEELGGDGPIFLRAGLVQDRGIDLTRAERFRTEKAGAVAGKMSRPGDVIVTTKGNSIGRTAFIGDALPPVVYSPHLSYWRSLRQDDLVPGYLRYWSQSEGFRRQLASMAGSTDMAPYLSLADQRRLRIPIPPAAEQRRSTRILGALDNKIELNRRMNETLEAMARALFKSWFVNFDPVRARAEGDDPGLPQPISDLFPDRFEESELGDIPAGWRSTTLAELALLNPESWSTPNMPETLDYVDLSNTKWGRIDAITRHPSRTAPSRARRILRPGDTIVGTVRPGNGSYALVGEEGLTGSTGFTVLRPRRPELTELVYLGATDRPNIDALAHLADGAAYPAVRPDVVLATPCVISSDVVAARFSELTRPMLGRITTNDAESRTLVEIRDALLPWLVSGQLRLREAERMLKAAAV